MSEEFREYYVGKQVTALMEEAYEFEGERYFTGYTKEYVKIAVKSVAEPFESVCERNDPGQIDR